MGRVVGHRGGRMQLTCTINDLSIITKTDPFMRLLDFLRQEQGLTGTKEGCGEGECGACAVLINGALANSCLIPMGLLHRARIETIEALDTTSPLGRAFIAEGATQCGICTPGMMMAATALLRSTPQPTDTEIKAALSGNLCRCTGYTRIYAAIKRASAEEPYAF